MAPTINEVKLKFKAFWGGILHRLVKLDVWGGGGFFPPSFGFFGGIFGVFFCVGRGGGGGWGVFSPLV